MIRYYSTTHHIFIFIILIYFYFYRYSEHRYLHSFPNDALPICLLAQLAWLREVWLAQTRPKGNAHLVRIGELMDRDRKSTRLNSSHVSISYAVFCLKKKKKT